LKYIYLSLGSNVGDRMTYLRSALAELAASGVHILRVSKVYETEPEGYLAQAWFLNLVAEVETRLFPQQLLKCIHRIERKLKRRRVFRNGPRTIDIDIVFYRNLTMKTETLEIPHPRYQERSFVLAPLADLIATVVVHSPPRVYSQSIENFCPSADSPSR
jgi:2-amino-4-hydroxy-6-hydroxymethyldihydropteridine diphosphokinase